MESYKSAIVPQSQYIPRDSYSDRPRDRRSQSQLSLGLVSTLSFPIIVSTADVMLKSSGVTLVGFEKIGSGQCTAIVRGATAEVRIAVQVGVEHAKREGQLLSSLVIPRPFPNLEVIFPIGTHFLEDVDPLARPRHSEYAVGLLETRGFPAIVGAADAMLKAADVQLTGYETIGAGLCTVIIRGNLAEVATALEVGVAEAKRIGELIAVTVITRPLEDLERALPIATCLIEEQPQPLRIPVSVKETEKELVQLPDLGKLPMPLKESQTIEKSDNG